ncbi:MAG: hypothetical protein ACJ8GN_26140, partial [Longimicrobiaceae bacterium]
GWHAVQQLQHRVRPTMSLAGTPVNVDARLEREASVMGARALAAGHAAQLRAARDGTPRRPDGGQPLRRALEKPDAPVTRLPGRTSAAQRMVAGDGDEVDLSWVYRVSNTHPKDLQDDFGVVAPIYGAVFPASADPGDIKTTLIGFSQQSMGAWLYRFPPPGGVEMKGAIPSEYWKGSVAGGQELTVGAVALDTVEVKVGAAWKKVSEIQEAIRNRAMQS